MTLVAEHFNDKSKNVDGQRRSHSLYIITIKLFMFTKNRYFMYLQHVDSFLASPNLYRQNGMNLEVNVSVFSLYQQTHETCKK